MKHFFGLALVMALVGGCSGSSASDNCTAFCTHSLSCAGQPTGGCGAACVDPALYNPYGGHCTDYPAYYDCLKGIPCANLTTDAGTNSTEVNNCKSSGGCQ